jgi:hypothetical protein
MGGHVDRLKGKSPSMGCVDPLGEAKNNFDASAEIGKLFGPIQLDIGS